ncbi:hypothetical protein K2Z84_31975 [Candidatus Binatia bacterium]|nr:hypothetical protein [Candidatus Binatia bacterium]
MKMAAATMKPAPGSIEIVEVPRKRPAPSWSKWATKTKPRRRTSTLVNPTTERTVTRSATDSLYRHARQQWMGRLGNTGSKTSEVSDDELIREAREWVDWRLTKYRQFRAAMVSDRRAMDDCVCITQSEPPDSSRKNYETQCQELIDAVAARRKTISVQEER